MGSVIVGSGYWISPSTSAQADAPDASVSQVWVSVQTWTTDQLPSLRHRSAAVPSARQRVALNVSQDAELVSQPVASARPNAMERAMGTIGRGINEAPGVESV